MASADSFRFRVLLALRRVPLHVRSAATAQTILGSCCSDVQLTDLRDTPKDDDTEFFVVAWCWHPGFIDKAHIIFVPEPRLFEDRDSAPGLRYLVRVRVVAVQDASEAPSPPSPGNPSVGGDVNQNDRDDDADFDHWPSPKRNDSDRDSWDSNYNGVHPGMDCVAVMVGGVSCPLGVSTPTGEPEEPVAVLIGGNQCPTRALPPIGGSEGSASTLTQSVRRAHAASPRGFVGSFLEIAPHLLHDGRGSTEPLHADGDGSSASDDWWSDLVHVELASSGGAPPALSPEGGSPSPTAGMPVLSEVERLADAPAQIDQHVPIAERLQAEVCLPLQTPLIKGTPRRRRARTPPSVSIRRSRRIAARARAPNATMQAQKVLLRKMGAQVADVDGVSESEVKRKFLQAFHGNISDSKRQALQTLLTGGVQFSSLALDLHGLEEEAA